MNHKHFYPGLLLFLFSFLPSCSDPQEPASSPLAQTKPVVEATNYTLYYFAQRIAGVAIQLNFLPGQKNGDPAYWEPLDQEIIQLQKADIILSNGATYEKWMASASLPQATLVNTTKSFSGEFLSSGELITHRHGTDGEHTHGGIAFTTWLDFQQAIWQAEAVRDALVRLVPAQQAPFNQNFEALADDLDSLHQRFKALGKALKGVHLVASHPVYQYFARRYGLNIKAVHWEAGTAPDEKAISELKTILENHPAKWMLWESTPLPQSVEKLASSGMGSVVINPCGNRPEKGDWLSVMLENVESLSRIVP